jgi:hypothetical protein
MWCRRVWIDADAYRSAVPIQRFEPARTLKRAWSPRRNDPDQERAVHWARSALMDSQGPRSICIAVPTCESHHRVVRQLDAILRPDDAEPAAATSPYNASGAFLSVRCRSPDALTFSTGCSELYHHRRIDSLIRSHLSCGPGCRGSATTRMVMRRDIPRSAAPRPRAIVQRFETRAVSI